MSTSPLDLDPYVIPMLRGEKILDLGCGYGHWGHLARTHYAALQSARVTITGVDLFEGNVTLCRGMGVYDEVVHEDVLAFLARQADGAFDSIIAAELIEHFSREDGAKLLDQLDRVAAKVVVVSTPNYAAYRGGGETMVGFNEWEHHLSQWAPVDFRARGYKVMGVSHKLHKRVPGAYRVLTKFPTLNALARAYAETHPSIALNLLAVKHMDTAPTNFVFGLG